MRDRQTDRQTETERQRQTDGRTDRQTDTERQTETDRHTHTQSEREKDRQRRGVWKKKKNIKN